MGDDNEKFVKENNMEGFDLNWRGVNYCFTDNAWAYYAA